MLDPAHSDQALAAYNPRTDDITLTPELEQYAAEAIAAGRYHDISEVVQAGVSLLKRAEAELAEFITSLEDAREEGEREGFHSAEDIHREMSAMLNDLTPKGT